MWLSVSWASSRSWTLKVSTSHAGLDCSGGRWRSLCLREHWTGRAAGGVEVRCWASRGHSEGMLARSGLCSGLLFSSKLVPNTSPGPTRCPV